MFLKLHETALPFLACHAKLLGHVINGFRAELSQPVGQWRVDED